MVSFVINEEPSLPRSRLSGTKAGAYVNGTDFKFVTHSIY